MLAELTDGWLASQRSEHTRDAYGVDLARFVAWCRQRDLWPLSATADDIAEYGRAGAADGVGDATVARRVSVVSSFFQFAVEQQIVTTNPARTVVRPGVGLTSSTPALDRFEVAALLDAAERLGPRTATLVALLLLDGLKLNEALAIDIGDLAGKPPDITLRIGRRPRPVLIALDRRTATNIAIQSGGRMVGPLMLTQSPTHRGARLSRFGADHLLKQAATEAGIATVVSANVLRRTFVAAAMDTGRSLSSIQVQLGHHDQRTTRRLA